MNWPTLSSIIEHLLESIHEVDPPYERSKSAAEANAKLVAREGETAESVDATVRQLVRANPVEPPPEEQYFLRERLIFAQMLVLAICTPFPTGTNTFLPVLPTTVDRESVVEWALIDVWRAMGKHWWASHLGTETPPI